MRPETAAEALGLVVHRLLHPEHSGSGCCSFLENDLAEGAELIEGLAEIGWLPPRPAVDLPDSVPAGDPKTSARTIDGLKHRTFAVWQLVAAQGPRGITSVELNEQYARLSKDAPGVYPPQRFDSPRKRLPELERAGHLAKTDRTRDGAAVWVARAESAVAA